MSSSPAPSAPAPAGDLGRSARLSALARELAEAAGDAAALDSALAERLRIIAGELEDQAAERTGTRNGFKAIMDASRDAIVSADESGRIVFAGGGAEQMFGWAHGEVPGRSLEILMPERYRAGLARFAATGEAWVIGRTVELEGLRRDGEGVHWRSHAGLVRDAEGLAQHFVITLEDVTERRRMLEALTLSEARYRALVENLPDTVITLFDGDLRLLVAEGGGLERLGRAPAEVEGRLLGEILGGAGMAEVEAGYRGALLGEGRSFDFEDASGVTWWMQVAPMHDEAGRTIAGMAVWRDVSARKRAERSLLERASELERSNAELEQFAYVASHDLAEPLRMVTSYLQLLERRYHGRLDPDADEFIRYAVDGAARMRALIDDLLAYSRTGRGEARRETVDTAGLVERVSETLTAGRAGPGATIHLGDLPAVEGDPAQLGQLFQNLLGNALKFIPPDRAPEIEVSAAARADGPGWVFTIADNGIGFEPAQADRIFRMFQRLHARDEYPGTGVGLAIARKVVERHGGRIWAERRPEGGALFRFELPEAIR